MIDVHNLLRVDLRLHIGHKLLLLSKKGSMQSTWYMWRQGSSLTCDSLRSKSSRHIAQVVCENTADARLAPDVVSGVDKLRAMDLSTSATDMLPVLVAG